MPHVTVIIRSIINSIYIPIFLIALTCYFIWNALHGEHGIQAYQNELKIQAEAEKALDEAHQEQDVWRKRVNALSEKSLDPDMLDERSRAMLNDSRNGDIIVPYSRHERLY